MRILLSLRYGDLREMVAGLVCIMKTLGWGEMIEKDSNIIAEPCPPKGNSASMLVTRCFINEVSRDVGLLPLAGRLCYGDYLFWEHYHPNITFSRTQTLVNGDPVCDHTVTWTERF